MCPVGGPQQLPGGRLGRLCRTAASPPHPRTALRPPALSDVHCMHATRPNTETHLPTAGVRAGNAAGGSKVDATGRGGGAGIRSVLATRSVRSRSGSNRAGSYLCMKQGLVQTLSHLQFIGQVLVSKKSSQMYVSNQVGMFKTLVQLSSMLLSCRMHAPFPRDDGISFGHQ